MDGGLIAQAVGAFGQGALAGRENARRRQLEDQTLAAQQQRLQTEDEYRRGMIANAEAALQERLRAAEAAAQERQAATERQAAEYQEAVQALVQRGVPEAEARVIARDQTALRGRLAPVEQPQTPWQKDGFGTPEEALDWARRDAAARRAPQAGGGSPGQYVDSRGGYVRPDGSFTPVQGLPDRPSAAGGPPPRPTEAQEKSFLYFDTMSNAFNEMQAIEQSGPVRGWAIQTALRTPFGAGNVVLSPAEQQYLRAARDFTAGILRKESGAAIKDDEVRDVFQRFIEGPGDSPEVRAAKQAARERYMAAMKDLAAPAVRYYDWTRGTAGTGASDEVSVQDELDLIRANARGGR